VLSSSLRRNLWELLDLRDLPHFTLGDLLRFIDVGRVVPGPGEDGGRVVGGPRVGEEVGCPGVGVGGGVGQEKFGSF